MYIATEPCSALAVVIHVSALQVQGFSLVPPPKVSCGGVCILCHPFLGAL